MHSRLHSSASGFAPYHSLGSGTLALEKLASGPGVFGLAAEKLGPAADLERLEPAAGKLGLAVDLERLEPAAGKLGSGHGRLGLGPGHGRLGLGPGRHVLAAGRHVLAAGRVGLGPGRHGFAADMAAQNSVADRHNHCEYSFPDEQIYSSPRIFMNLASSHGSQWHC